MFPDLYAGKPELLADPTGRKWYDMIKSGQGAQAAIEIIMSFSDGTFPKSLIYAPDTRGYRNAWMDTIAAADQYNDPGRFTAFIGYEWTSNTGSMNLHRNVVFRDNGDRARQVLPYTTMKPLGSDNPADLWKWMDDYEKKTGGSVLAIAHNGNLSNGLMFPVVEAFGKKTRSRVRRDAREMGAALRDDPDQGHGRIASFPLAERRIRGLRDLGQGEPRRKRGQDEGDARVRVRALRAQERTEAGAAARDQPLQVRPGGIERRAYGPRSHGGGQLLRQDHAAGAEPRAHARDVLQQSQDRRHGDGLGSRRVRLRRRVGHREHARGDLGRDGAPGDLRDDRPAHGRTLLRRLRLHGGRRTHAQPRGRSATRKASRWAAT